MLIMNTDPKARKRIRSISLKISVFIIIALLLSIYGFELGYAEGDIVKLGSCQFGFKTVNETYELVYYEGGEINNVKIIFTRVNALSTCMIGPMIRIVSFI